ncbi:hypothetical protein PG997_000648 [Apiospora hydei]|uniref:Uncharacterized protein n=1 Tax=Apiospora hydei TaxID=1337664 RepID=A0ABR1XBJ5_9PEZI
MSPSKMLSILLSCVQLHYAWAISPTPTMPLVPIHAITPTMTGQIGINPVDIPPVTSLLAPIGDDHTYLSEIVTDNFTSTTWIAATTDFGTATINITSNGVVQPTTIPEGFKVTNNTNGLLEITFSPYIKDLIGKYLPQIPNCQALIVRDDDDVNANIHPERRRRLLLKKRADAALATACARRRGGRLSQLLSEDAEWGRQMSRFESQAIVASGHDAAALAEAGQTIALLEEETVAEILINEMAITDAALGVAAEVGTLFLEIAGAISFLFGVYEIAVGLWKVQSNAQPMNIFKPFRTWGATATATATPSPTSVSNCPTATDAPPCVGDRCQGSPDGVCSAPDFYGCVCLDTGSMIGDPSVWGEDFEDVQDLIYSFQIPQPNIPECVADTTDDTFSLSDNEFQLVFNTFCYNVDGTINSDADNCFPTSTLSIQIMFDNNGTSNDCSMPCHDAFDGLRDQCSYDSHTKYKVGFTEVTCGVAQYSAGTC